MYCIVCGEVKINLPQNYIPDVVKTKCLLNEIDQNHIYQLLPNSFDQIVNQSHPKFLCLPKPEIKIKHDAPGKWIKERRCRFHRKSSRSIRNLSQIFDDLSVDETNKKSK